MTSEQSGEWPGGAGEMARLIRAHDWAATPLGPVEDWSDRLRLMVEQVLASPLVSSLVCGPERLLIYNDAASRLYGDRHPGALGRPLPESFPEGWATVAPLYARAFAGESVAVKGQELDTSGGGGSGDVFDAYLTPVRESGAVSHVHMVGIEVGERVRARARLAESEERQAFLLALSDALRPLADPVAVQETAARLLGTHLAADRAYCVAMDEARQIATVAREYRRGEPASRVGEHPFAAYGATLERLRAGRAVAFDDVETEPGIPPDDRPAYRALGLRAFLDVPLIKGGELVCAVCVVSARPRRWTRDELALVAEVAERSWAAVERARAEAALRHSETRFRALVGASASMLYRMSPDWRLMWQLSGRDFLADTSEPAADWAEAYLLPEDRPAIFAAIEAALRTKSLFEMEHRVRRADGGVGWVFSRAVPLLDEAGAITEWFGAGNDVTERVEARERARRAEEANRDALERQVRERTAELSASRDLLRATMDSSPDMIQVFAAVRDASGAIVDFRWLLNNHTSESRYGEVRGQSLLERNPGVVPEGIFDTFKRVTETGIPEQAERHYVHEQFDGWFFQSVVKLGDGIATTTKEITAWKTAQTEVLRLQEAVAQARLRESEQRLWQFGEASSDVLWIRDAETLQWVYLTPAFEAIYGLDRETALGNDTMTNWLDLIVPEDRQRAFDCLQRVRAGERLAIEYRVRRPLDGAVRWLRDTDFPMHDADGRVRWLGGVGRDITAERAAAERQDVLVKELQHRSRNLIGVVTSLANRTIGRGSPVRSFTTRLKALSRAQALLSQSGSDTVAVEALVRAELAAHADGAPGRIAIAGQSVLLTSQQVQNFALALHELATNAVKYGALMDETGRLSVTWDLVEVSGREHLALNWIESGVDVPPEAATRRGYGRELIEQALAYALGGRTEFVLAAGGVRCRIELPLA